MSYIEELGKKAKAAKRIAACASTAMKNNALAAIADALTEKTELIISQNKLDLENAVMDAFGLTKAERALVEVQMNALPDLGALKEMKAINV